MSEPSSQQPDQSLNIAGNVLESVQIGGIAGRDLNLTQIQGGVGAINVFGRVQVPQAALSSAKLISQEEYRWRTVLLSRVRQAWIEGVLKKSLHTKVLIELGLEERTELVQNPLSGIEEYPSNSGRIFPEGTDATDIFEEIGAGRTLLILGEPGAGKTVTLLKLTESLIARSKVDPSQPLPVVINLSSWAQQRKAIVDWLVQELHKIYGVSKSLGKIWVEQEQLVLLLDGLDEVDIKYRNDCVKALNQFIQAHGLTEMVVCSRIRDYRCLSEYLKLRSAICVQSLTSQQTDQFLARAGEPLSALKSVLQNDADLRKFASSPLILSIMSLTYQNYSADMLTQVETLEERKNRLFEAYVERMLTRRGTAQQYSKGQTLHWLHWLAQGMMNSSQTTFLIERLQPSWLSSRRQRFSYRVESGLTAALFMGILTSRSVSDGAGILSAIVMGLVVGSLGDIETVQKISWSWKAVKRTTHFTLAWCLIGGPMFGLICGLILSLLCSIFYVFPDVYPVEASAPNGNLIDGLVGGLSMGLGVGLITWLSTFLFKRSSMYLLGGFERMQAKRDTNSSPANQNYLKLVNVLPVIYGSVLGLIGGFRHGLSGDFGVFSFMITLIVYFPIGGLLFGLLAGLLMGLSTPIFGLAGGFRGEGVLESNIPNHGIRETGKNALIITLIAALLTLSGKLIFGFEVGKILDAEIIASLNKLANYLANKITLIPIARVTIALIIGLTIYLLFALFFTLIIAPIAWAAYMLIDALSGMKQHVWRSAKVASVLVLTVITAPVATVWLSDEMFSALGGACFLGLICGGSACLRHLALRLMLYRQDHAPWNYTRFLDYAAERLFMQKVGGGYIFVHRMLLEHFAQMQESQPNNSAAPERI